MNPSWYELELWFLNLRRKVDVLVFLGDYFPYLRYVIAGLSLLGNLN
jgi:hypothetical protein